MAQRRAKRADAVARIVEDLARERDLDTSPLVLARPRRAHLHDRSRLTEQTGQPGLWPVSTC